MAFEATTILQLVLLLTWTCLSTCPNQQKHPLFSKVLSTKAILDQLLSSVSVAFAPGLFDVLQSSTPPTVAFFKTLPTHCHELWAVYLIVLEAQGRRPKIYIGSGTDARKGVSGRLPIYHDSSTSKILPSHVRNVLRDGYSIVHKGLICWIPLPDADSVPILRVVMLVLEAVFTYVFWALHSKTDYGYGLLHMCPWDWDNLEYDGLCSHNPLTDPPIRNFDLTPEELEAQAAEHFERRAQYFREWEESIKNSAPEAYLAKKREQRKAFVEKHPDAPKISTKRSQVKAVELKTHYCAICDHAFNRGPALRKHLAGPKHLAKAAKAAKLAKAAAKKLARPLESSTPSSLNSTQSSTKSTTQSSTKSFTQSSLGGFLRSS